MFLNSNPGGNITMQSDGNYINVTCPDYSTSSTSCTIDSGDRDVCSTQTSLYCYNGI